MSRTNRVRGGKLEASGNKLSFQDHDVREAARKRLGDEGVRSWLDPNAWDPPARTIVCKLNFTADRLTRELSGDLKVLGVKVVCDKRRFAELMQTGRSIVSELFEGAT